MTTSTLQHNDNKADEVENRVIKKLFRRLITFLFVLFVFSFLDRINIGFAGLTMGKDLGLTSTMFGLAATLFYVTYVLCGIPSNIMLAKVGARRWIAGIMVVWGIASTCTMFATSPHTLYILRMLVGIAEAGFLPGILVYLTWWFPAYHRARANALFYDRHAGDHDARLDTFRLYSGARRPVEPERLAMAISAGRPAVGGARRRHLVLPQRHAG
ncbi:4-hydroxyphenylacetate permease [Klebsiella pneumoniae]|nr:4-hydroxyphenylacetate permease [Klebsiella pneumoniae]